VEPGLHPRGVAGPGPTFGGHGQLPAEKLDALLSGLSDAVDAMDGSFSTHYTAVVVTAVRSGT
jgi:hypothetical protein